MRTIRKINRPIKFFGLTSGQFGLFMLANGNPDYLTGLSVRSATPKQIIDKHKVFNFIMKQK